MNVYFGLDVATEDARLIIISDKCEILDRFKTKLANVKIGSDLSRRQDSNSWGEACAKLITKAVEKCQVKNWIPQAISITATSGTFVITDENGKAISDAVMYNDGTADDPISRAQKLAVTGYFKHVPEMVISHLTKQNFCITDSSHALKTGYDLNQKLWQILAKDLNLPEVIAPGKQISEITIKGKVIKVISGMTDGCTAQISGGGVKMNDAVTTLGTTMVIKQSTDSNISGAGFYSHYLADNHWLAGGASNLGGISYREFNNLDSLAKQINLSKKNYVVCYPLADVGERFPIKDNKMKAIWSQMPTERITKYQSILEGIGYAERMGYEVLQKGGAKKFSHLATVGGGSKSMIWNQIRANILQSEISIRNEAGSDLGAAMIAVAASQVGNFANNLAALNLQPAKVVEPNKALIEHYQKNYEKFGQLILANQR